MSAKDSLESSQAAAGIFVRQREMEQALLKNLYLLQKKPGENLRRFEGPFHSTVSVLGYLRVKEAVGALLPFIDFQLDPSTMRAGGFGAPSSFYPLASALAEIGGPNVRDAISLMLNYRHPDRTLRACAWVLYEMLGQRIASAAIAEEVTSEAKRLLPEQWTGSVHKANLERIQTLLQEPASILIDPNDEAQAATVPPDAVAK